MHSEALIVTYIPVGFAVECMSMMLNSDSQPISFQLLLFFTAVSPTPNPSDPAVPLFKRRYSSESGTLTKKWAWFSLVSVFDCWLTSDFDLKNPTSSCPALLITPFWYSCGVTRIWFKKGELPPFLTEVFSERCLGLIFQICPCLSQIPSNKNTKSG